MSESISFTLGRTSAFSDFDPDKPPHDRAEASTIETYSYWTFRSLPEAQRRHPDTTFERVNGSIRSGTGPKQCWRITFTDLADLMSFINDVGPVVMNRNWRNHDEHHIEIYDDYRE